MPDEIPPSPVPIHEDPKYNLLNSLLGLHLLPNDRLEEWSEKVQKRIDPKYPHEIGSVILLCAELDLPAELTLVIASTIAERDNLPLKPELIKAYVDDKYSTIANRQENERRRIAGLPPHKR
jgi:hypothetical protein